MSEKIINMLEDVAGNLEPVSGARIAAAVVRRNRVIALGWNQNKSHPFQSRFSKCAEAIYLHAEVDAIKNALKVCSVDELKNCTLYVSRMKYSKDEQTLVQGMSKPCTGCMRAIATFGISEVYYSTEEGDYQFL